MWRRFNRLSHLASEKNVEKVKKRQEIIISFIAYFYCIILTLQTTKCRTSLSDIKRTFSEVYFEVFLNRFCALSCCFIVDSGLGEKWETSEKVED